jgi:hypothetical protein
VFAGAFEYDGAMASRMLEIVRTYPVITAIIVGATAVGVVIGIFVFPEDWTLARKIAGGALGGAGCGLIVTAPRIVG